MQVVMQRHIHGGAPEAVQEGDEGVVVGSVQGLQRLRQHAHPCGAGKRAAAGRQPAGQAHNALNSAPPLCFGLRTQMLSGCLRRRRPSLCMSRPSMLSGDVGS